MTHEPSLTDIRQLLDPETDAMLFLECGNCKQSSSAIAQAEEFLRDPHDELHTLRVTDARSRATDCESMDELLHTVAEAIVNDGDDGHLHFECASCGTENVTGSPTVGKQGRDSQLRVIFLQGSTKTYPLPERRSLRWKRQKFECGECGCLTDPETMVTEGPDAPEIGWTYAECPKCNEHYHLKQVGISPALTA